MANTVLSTINLGTSDELTQARFDRGLNSKLVKYRNRVLKTARPGMIEREHLMLTTAREAGLSVPHSTVIDEYTLSLQFIPHGETLWDYIYHNKLTKSLLAKVKAELIKMWKIGIVHGDLHVNNILISNGKVYIIDMASSWNVQVLEESFGEDDYSKDLRDGIAADQAAFKASFLDAREEAKYLRG